MDKFLAQLKSKVKSGAKTVGNWFTPDANPNVRPGEFVREVPGATANVAKEILKGFTRFGLSAGSSLAEVPIEIKNLLTPGKQIKIPTMEPEKIPGLGFLGPIETYQNQARRETAKGGSGMKSFLKTAGNIAVDEPVGVALKPLGIAFAGFMKSGGGKLVENAIKDLVKAVKPSEVKAILKGMGVTEKVATESADALAKAGTRKEVEAILQGGVKDIEKKVYYHGTPKKYADDIIKNGYDSKKAIELGHEKSSTFFLSNDKGYAGEYKNTLLKEGDEGVVIPFNIKDEAIIYDVAKDEVRTEGGKVIQKNVLETINGKKGMAHPDFKGQDYIVKKYKVDVVSTKNGLETEVLNQKIVTPVKDVARETSEKAVSQETKVVKPTQRTAKPMQKEGTLEDAGVKSVGDILKERGGAVPPKGGTTEEFLKGGAPKEPERKFITRTKEMAPEMTDLLKGKYTPKSNIVLKQNAEELIAKNYQAAETMARTGIDDQAVAVASKMIEDELAIARKATDEATKNKAYAKAAEIANDAARNLTEAGRAVQAASLLGKMTPEGMARYAARQIQKYNEQAGARTVKNFLGGAKKIPELSKDQLKEIADGMEAINKMKDGTDKARALQKLGEKIQSYIPSTLYQKIINVWKAGLLTGFKTTGVNVASNLSHAVTEIVKDVPASIVDKITSLFTGKRTLVLTGKGTGKGAAEGIAKGWDYLKTGFDERNIADKLDYKKVNFGKGKVANALKAYTDTVFGVLGAEDQPFYYAAKMRSLGNQAAAMAKNEGLSGKAAKDFAQKLIDNPTDDMLKYSALDAETAVFQQDSWLSKKAKTLQKGLEVILPFAKTPANVATAMFNYTPAGIVKTVIENIGKGRFDQRLFAQGIGRGITGTAALAIGAALYGKKMISLSIPTSEKERKQWELEGRTPNSILINGRWRNVGVLGPLGMVLIVGGHIKDGLDKTGSLAGGLIQSAGGFGSALTEQSFLRGINDTIDAIKDPARSFKGWASSLAGSIIPTLVSDIARGTDTYERRANSPGERLQSRIPGARQNLEPQVDVLGRKKKTGNFFEVMFDPTRPALATADIKDPVVLELRRMIDAGYNVTPTQLGNKDGYKTLSPEQNTRLWQLAGNEAKKQITRIIGLPEYKQIDDEKRQRLVQKYVDLANDMARAQIAKEVTKGLKGKTLEKKINEMVDDKLLTQEVLKRYYAITQ